MSGARLAVVGAGPVGLVTGAGLASRGHAVVCVDREARLVDAVNRGEPLVREPGLAALVRDGIAHGRLRATTDLAAAVSDADITFIAVGTPAAAAGIDVSQVVSATEAVARALAGGTRPHLVVVKSSVIPGTTDGAVLETLQTHRGRRTAPIGLCVNPEFLREGSAVDDFLRPDRIVIGADDETSGAALAAVYGGFGCPIVRTSCRNAELIKYASNAALAILVSFANEIAALCERMPGLDVDAVMDGLGLDRRWSPVVGDQRVAPEILAYLRAGVGFGGSCLPKDVDALRAFARSLGVTPRLLDAVAIVNDHRTDEIADLVDRALGGLAGRRVAVLGVAFKPGTDDVRDSAAVRAISCLLARHARVTAYDPLASPAAPELPVLLSPTSEDAVRDADAVLIATACPEFRQLDWNRLLGLMRRPIIVDGRRALTGVSLPAAAEYWPIGRSGQIED